MSGLSPEQRAFFDRAWQYCQAHIQRQEASALHRHMMIRFAAALRAQVEADQAEASDPKAARGPL